MIILWLRDTTLRDTTLRVVKRNVVPSIACIVYL